MLAKFFLPNRLSNACLVNSIIFTINRLPGVSHFLPDNLYESRGLKLFAQIIAVIINLIKYAFFVAVYFFCLFVLPCGLMESAVTPTVFFHIYTIVCVLAALVNCHYISADNRSYYCIKHLKMSAKSYTIKNVTNILIIKYIQLTFAFLIFSNLLGLFDAPVYACFLLPLFNIEIKLIIFAINLRINHKRVNTASAEKSKKALYIKFVLQLLFLTVLMTAAYLPVYYGLYLPEIVVFILLAVGLPFTALAIVKIKTFKHFEMLYKVAFSEAKTTDSKQTAIEANVTYYSKTLDKTEQITSSKSGYSFFNELFLKRHRRLLIKPAVITSYIVAATFLVLTVFSKINPKVAVFFVELGTKQFTLFLFILYACNSGQRMTNAMFFNCDISMLSYRFYRTPKVIHNIYFARLKYIALVNLLPAITISLGFDLLLFVCGVRNFLPLIIIPATYCVFSILMSVHNLNMYYLLQPYTANAQMKSIPYAIMTGLTYLVCYSFIQIKIDMYFFAAVALILSVLYFTATYFLIKYAAPKTFRLK